MQHVSGKMKGGHANVPVATREYEARLCRSVGEVVVVTSGAVEVTVVVTVARGATRLQAELIMLAGKAFNGNGV
jgi:hypothetical protein